MKAVESFFDNLAPSWDACEGCLEETKRELLSRIKIKEGDRVIDLACGTGVVTDLIHELSHEDVLGIDISSEMLKIARKKYRGRSYAHFVHADFMEMDMKEAYDYVVIYNAYPHFMDPKALSKKLASSLKEGGRFAIVHSLSRKELSRHHSGKVHPLSRDLLPPNEEAIYFKDEFEIELSEEGERHYLLLGRKK